MQPLVANINMHITLSDIWIIRGFSLNESGMNEWAENGAKLKHPLNQVPEYQGLPSVIMGD